jgi:hypothetical protein
MSNITPLQIVEQVKLNKSIATTSSDSALFRLYLAMANQDASHGLKFKEESHNSFSSEIVSHYRQANLNQTTLDFVIQNEYSKSIQNRDFYNLRLLSSFHPQPLSKHNDPMHIDEEVIENSAYPVKQRLFALNQLHNDQIQNGQISGVDEIQEAPTMLFDILESLDEINF